MKTFLVILAAGLALLAIDGALVAFGRGWEPRSPTSLAEAEKAVEDYLAATRVLERSGGDPRVAERVPAAPDLVSELLAGMAFAERRLGVRERDDLIRIERRGSRWLPDGAAEVRTREYWVYRESALDGSGPVGTSVASVCDVRYDLTLDGSSWRVVDFHLGTDAPAPGDG